jgi:hypothetical protein
MIGCPTQILREEDAKMRRGGEAELRCDRSARPPSVKISLGIADASTLRLFLFLGSELLKFN